MTNDNEIGQTTFPTKAFNQIHTGIWMPIIIRNIMYITVYRMVWQCLTCTWRLLEYFPSAILSLSHLILFSSVRPTSTRCSSMISSICTSWLPTTPWQMGSPRTSGMALWCSGTLSGCPLKVCKIFVGSNSYSYHYNDVIMGAMASQITSLTIVYSTVYPGADQRKHQSSASLAFVWGIHRSPASNVDNVSIWWRHHVLPESMQWCKQYHVILHRIITSLYYVLY